MIGRPARLLRSNPLKTKIEQIEFGNKDIDHPNRVVLADPILQAFRKQRALMAIHALDKTLHPIPRLTTGRESQSQSRFHTVWVISGSQSLPLGTSALWYKAVISGQKADI